jgi:NAD dependent epimerase/dehydratase family enzyme
MGRELTDEVVLAGQRVLPTVAQARGFTFSHPDVERALRALLGK